jgi:CspA family cold shock protein
MLGSNAVFLTHLVELFYTSLRAEGGDGVLPRGVVKWFNNKKGYGFLTPESGGDDIFIHFSDICGDGFRSLQEGDTVEYDLIQSEKGAKAVGLKKVGGS